jgi:hypothetical protein
MSLDMVFFFFDSFESSRYDKGGRSFEMKESAGKTLWVSVAALQCPKRADMSEGAGFRPGEAT